MELDFPIEEYEDRVRRVQEKLRDRALDALIVQTPEIVHYLCGYDAAWLVSLAEFSGLIVFASVEPVLVTRTLESKAVKKQVARVRLFSELEGPWRLLTEIMTEAGVAEGVIGIEEGTVTVRKLNRLKEILPRARVVNAEGLVEALMAAPSKREVELVKRAGLITRAGFRRAVETIREGVPLYEVMNRATEAMYEAGMTEQRLSGTYTMSLAWAGPDGGAMHESDVTRKVKYGDLVNAEIWGTYKHYTAASQGTVYVGQDPAPEIVNAYNVLAQMYLSMRDVTRPGVPVSEVWAAGNSVYRAAYGVDYYRTLGPQQGSAALLGRIGPNVGDCLKAGSAYFLQPLVNDPLFASVAATVLVTENGCVEITEPLLSLVTVR